MRLAYKLRGLRVRHPEYIKFSAVAPSSYFVSSLQRHTWRFTRKSSRGRRNEGSKWFDAVLCRSYPYPPRPSHSRSLSLSLSLYLSLSLSLSSFYLLHALNQFYYLVVLRYFRPLLPVFILTSPCILYPVLQFVYSFGSLSVSSPALSEISGGTLCVVVANSR
jgi:hypothetical protein